MDEKSKTSSLEKQLALETSTLRSLQKSLDVTSVDLELNSSRDQTKVVAVWGFIEGIDFNWVWNQISDMQGQVEAAKVYELIVLLAHFSIN